MPRIALCQLPVSDDPAVNLERVEEALGEATERRADLAVFPEATLVRFGTDLRARAEPLDGPFGSGLAAATGKHRVAAVAGVFEPAGAGRVHNTAVVYDAGGHRVAAYRKIHLFDALGQRESDLVAAGTDPVVVELGGVRYGLITCYDIRFPELARALVDRGAQVLVVIAAWGAGAFKEEHWTTLVRARAIENTIWVAAADQVPEPGSGAGGAPTGVGRSLLVDPLGVVRADLGPDPGVFVGEVDLELTERVRSRLPSLRHRRL